MINISQHAIIPLGYPSQYGYYNSSGTLINSTSYKYRSLKKSYTFGCNKVYRAVPYSSSYSSLYYGNIRLWDKSFVEPVYSSTVNFNQPNSVFNFNGSYDINSFMTTKDTIYFPILNYPFLIFFKDNTPSVASLSLGNPLSSDVINDEEEMI